MNKRYTLFFTITLLFHSPLLYSQEEISYEDQITSLKTELTQLREQRDDLLITLQKELKESKSSTSYLWFVLNPVFIMFVSNFIKDPSLANFLIFIPYLSMILPKVLPQSNKTATSLLVVESTIKQRKEKMKELKSNIRPFD